MTPSHHSEPMSQIVAALPPRLLDQVALAACGIRIY